jgi:hypothetical protein
VCVCVILNVCVLARVCARRGSSAATATTTRDSPRVRSWQVRKYFFVLVFVFFCCPVCIQSTGPMLFITLIAVVVAVEVVDGYTVFFFYQKP